MVKRQQVWIDSRVQGALVGRVMLYLLGLTMYFAVSYFCFQWWQNPDWSAGEHFKAIFEESWPGLPLLLLLPIVIFDFVRLSHRFVGPVHRLRSHLERLNADASTHPLNFRDDDYWQKLADPINTLQVKILSLEQQLTDLRKVELPTTAAPATAMTAQDRYVLSTTN